MKCIGSGHRAVKLSGTVYSSLYTEGSKIMGAVHGSYFPKELARLLIISY